MDISQWVGVAGTILGVIIGGFLAYFTTSLQLRYQTKEQSKEKKIIHCETIHKLLSIIDHESSIVCLTILAKEKQGFITPIEKDKPKIPIDELKMLINFYIPELEENLNEINKHWGDLGRALGVSIMENYKIMSQSEILAIAQSASGAINKEVLDAKNKLGIVIKELI